MSRSRPEAQWRAERQAELLSAPKTNNKAPVARKSTRRRIQLWLAFVVVFSGWGVYTYVGQMLKMQDLQQEFSAQEEVHSKTLQKRDELQNKVNKLNTEEYLLDIARSKGMLRPDEILIRKQDE
ncbi:MAG: septum formation initiator family protein [Paenibacillus sp.]|uniref:Septum formation initiator n=1 Tax=Paenibacillus aquistagni TaxID=1852522 RepID=A0A1X7M0G5_9BACL|nr:septum formation initiator family protein [Paenibacillus aquistagni]MBR2567854.1 septum formation initiator family protein [Paenibacillus sp.]NMM55240.1 septum formation initiator family protein [Paenibacillus aquistagni]SMG59013.1 Septum formation initiator [Paenibacillus aquistagni]